jgi:hypothetical protein
MKIRALAMGILGLGFLAHPSLAQTSSLSCSAALAALSADWDAVAYPDPAKPSQAVVVGRNGHTASGAQVTFMRNQIRLASQDCQSGSDASAMQRISKVRALLTPSAGQNG